MFSQQQIPIQNMINNGQFGYNMPMQNNGVYNPYAMQQNQVYNNIMPIGQIGYNQPQNNMVFAPVMGAGGYYQQQQPQYDYYDPYGTKRYGNPYANYNNYGYNNQYYYNPQRQQKLEQERRNQMKLKYRIVDGFFGRKRSEEELNDLVTPKTSRMTQEEIDLANEYNTMKMYNNLCNNPPLMNSAIAAAQYINNGYNYIHETYDTHSLTEFLHEDLWRINLKQWEDEHIKFKGRDMSSSYNSDKYNELLNMHRSSNPTINELLDSSRYDNNIDDMEIGLDVILDMQKRRKAVLEGRVPSYISSPEAQQRRSEFMSRITSQLKGGNNIV